GLALGRALERRGERSADLWFYAFGGMPGILEAQAQVVGACAADGDALGHGRNLLEVGVPDPGDILAISGAVVEQHGQMVALAVVCQSAQYLVDARRILGEQQVYGAPFDADALGTTELRREAVHCLDHGGQWRAHDGADSGSDERVVDVIEAGQRDARL